MRRLHQLWKDFREVIEDLIVEPAQRSARGRGRAGAAALGQPELARLDGTDEIPIGLCAVMSVDRCRMSVRACLRVLYRYYGEPVAGEHPRAASADVAEVAHCFSIYARP